MKRIESRDVRVNRTFCFIGRAPRERKVETPYPGSSSLSGAPCTELAARIVDPAPGWSIRRAIYPVGCPDSLSGAPIVYFAPEYLYRAAQFPISGVGFSIWRHSPLFVPELPMSAV